MIYFQNSFFSPLLSKPRGFFSDVDCGNMVELLEVNITIFWWPPIWLHPIHTLEFLTLGLVHTEPPIINQYSSGFPTQHRWSLFLFTSLCCGKLWFPASVCLSYPSWQQGFDLCSSSLMDPRIFLKIFSLFRFLIVIRTKWQCLSFLPTGPQILSLDSIFNNFFLFKF